LVVVLERLDVLEMFAAPGLDWKVMASLETALFFQEEFHNIAMRQFLVHGVYLRASMVLCFVVKR